MLINLNNTTFNTANQNRFVTNCIPMYSNKNPNLINSFDDVQLNGKILNKIKSAVKKVGDKIGDTKVMQAVKSTKPVQKIQEAYKKAPTIVKVFTAGLVAPTTTFTAATTSGLVGTTVGATKIAALPFKAIKTAVVKSKEKKAEKVAADETAFQKELQDIQNGVTAENTGVVPVSARTDAGNIATVQAQYAPDGSGTTYTTVQQAQTPVKAENPLLKYGLPIGLAALALFSNSSN